MVDFKSLLAKSKAEKAQASVTTETEIKPTNPFANLKTKIAKPPAQNIPKPTELPVSKPEQVVIISHSGPGIPSLTEHEITKPEDKLAREFSYDSQSEGMDAEAMESLGTALNMLQDNIEDKDIVSEAVKNVLNLLNHHDFLKKILKPEDCGLMVRGLRNSYGTTIAKKEARGTKAKATDAAVQGVLDNLGDLQVEL